MGAFPEEYKSGELYKGIKKKKDLLSNIPLTTLRLHSALPTVPESR